MNIRRLKNIEIDDSIKMSEFAFQLELTDEQRTNRKKMIDPNDTWVVTDNETVVSKMTVLPLETYIHGEKWLVGGVSGVVTWPEQRRSGHVRALLKKGLEEMKEHGQLVSFLYPFSISFYRKFGWELFCDRKFITISKEQLPHFTSVNGSIKRIDKKIELLDPMYQTFAAQYSGTLVRNYDWWEMRIFSNMKGQIAVFTNETGEHEGYLIYEVKERKMKLIEFIYLTSNAWRGIWNFISNHDSMIDTVEGTFAPNDPSMFFLKNPKAEEKQEAYFMARIVDAEPFLKQFPFQLEDGETIVLHVEDDFCDWNNGTYFIKGLKKCQHEVQIFQAKQGANCSHLPKRGISCSINSLTTMLFNYQKPSTLYQFSAISGNKSEIEALEKAIPPRPTMLFDFF